MSHAAGQYGEGFILLGSEKAILEWALTGSLFRVGALEFCEGFTSTEKFVSFFGRNVNR
jgi:hypothetical protein